MFLKLILLFNCATTFSIWWIVKCLFNKYSVSALSYRVYSISRLSYRVYLIIHNGCGALKITLFYRILSNVKHLIHLHGVKQLGRPFGRRTTPPPPTSLVVWPGSQLPYQLPHNSAKRLHRGVARSTLERPQIRSSQKIPLWCQGSRTRMVGPTRCRGGWVVRRLWRIVAKRCKNISKNKRKQESKMSMTKVIKKGQKHCRHIALQKQALLGFHGRTTRKKRKGSTETKSD